jgi:hypothetical protein
VFQNEFCGCPDLLIALLLGLCFGGAIAWLLMKSRSTQPMAEMAVEYHRHKQ